MATSSSAPPSSRVKTNYTRFSRLLTDIGTKVLRLVLDTLHPPADLQKHINSTAVNTALKSLRAKKVPNTQQWKTLHPVSGAPSSTTFDITLLFLLLRNTCGLTAPTTGWDAAPSPADISKEADLIRVKRCRNEITGHSTKAELCDVDFETHWAEIEAALVRLGGSQYDPDIQRLKIESVDPENEVYLNILLQSWEEGEDKKLDALREEIKAQLKDFQEEIKVQIKSEQIKPFCKCNLPQKPSHDTVYRHEEVSLALDEIRRLRTTYPNHVTVTYLSGNPGCGKSELARQIGQTHFQEVSSEESSRLVATLNASNLETLTQSYVELACQLQCNDVSHIMTSENNSQEQKLVLLQAIVIPMIQKYSSWLMIVDNVEDVKIVSKFIPYTGQTLMYSKGHILMTTQDIASIPRSDSHVHHIKLEFGMKLSDAIQTLHTISGLSCDENVAKKVCEKMDFQPLALACAAAYMQQVRYTDPTMNWEKYLEEVDKGNSKSAEEFFEKINLTYPKSMTTAVKMAVEKILEKSQVMRHTFELMAAIAPEFISLEHVLNYVLQCMPEMEKSSVAAAITCSSLVTTSEHESKQLFIRVHQVVYHVLQATSLQAVNEFSFFMKFVNVFSYMEGMKKNTVRFIQETAPLIRHFVSFSEKVKQYFEGHQIVEVKKEGSLCGVHYQANKLFTHQYIPLVTFLTKIVSEACTQHGKYNKARTLYEISYCLIERCYSSAETKDGTHNNHPEVATMLDYLGSVLIKLGHFDEAKECFERKLIISEITYGSNSPDVAKTMLSLAIVLNNIGKNNEAEEYCEKALAIYRSTHGSNHLDFAIALHNLGTVLENLGKLDEAKTIYENALTLYRTSYGSNHPNVAVALHHLGSVLNDLGKLDEAKKCFEKALAIDESTYGGNHPELCATLHYLGSVLNDLGKLDEAKKCFEKALEINESTYGSNHRYVATTLHNLGSVLNDLGKLDEAKKCFEKALAIDESTYGSNHPELCATLHYLGLVLYKLGKLDEAKKCYEKALEINESTYGSNHRKVATTLHYLGSVLDKLGKPDEAKKCFEKALAIKESTYGSNHPEDATTLNNLGSALDKLGKLDEAK